MKEQGARKRGREKERQKETPTERKRRERAHEPLDPFHTQARAVFLLVFCTTISQTVQENSGVFVDGFDCKCGALEDCENKNL